MTFHGLKEDRRFLVEVTFSGPGKRPVSDLEKTGNLLYKYTPCTSYLFLPSGRLLASFLVEILYALLGYSNHWVTG